MIKKQAPARNAPLLPEQTPRPSTQLFNATPRFTFSSTPRPTATPTAPTPTPYSSRYVTPARQIPKNEDIIDSSSDDILEDVEDVHQSIETQDRNIDPGYLSTDVEDDYNIEERSPKRMRLSSSPAPQENDQALEQQENITSDESSPVPSLPSPPAARPPVSSTAPRFLPSTRVPQSTPQPSQTTFLKPPRFRPPDTPEQAQSNTDPLPEQFSPHRRGQKYVPGGLAAEVRDWLVNIESAIPWNSAQKKDGAWLVKIMADEVSGGGRAGMTLVRGKQVQSGDLEGTTTTMGERKIILAGQGEGTGLQKGSEVEVGSIVGIKGPVWEVVIEGEKWGVGVDWKVLP